jgi:hypothetical protein
MGTTLFFCRIGTLNIKIETNFYNKIMLATPYTKMSFPTLNPARISGNFETTRPLQSHQWANLSEWATSEITSSQSFDFAKMVANLQHDDVTIRRSHQREWTKILQKAAFTNQDSQPSNGPKLEKFRKAKCGPRYSHIRLIDITQILIDHRIKVTEWHAEQKSRIRVKTEFDLRIESYEDARWRYKNGLTIVNAPSIFGISQKLTKDELDKRMLEWDSLNPKPTRKVEQVQAEPELVIEQVEVDDWEQLA